MTWYRDNDNSPIQKKPGENTYYTAEETKEIYNSIIFAFQAIVDDDSNWEIKIEKQKRIRQGLELFAKHLQGFWT